MSHEQRDIELNNLQPTPDAAGGHGERAYAAMLDLLESMIDKDPDHAHAVYIHELKNPLI